MTTIEEDYVSFEIARQLKEKGFNEQCFTYYDNTNDSINRFDKGYHFNNTSYPWGVPYNINNAKKYVCAPTLQMAMKWLREVHNIHIVIKSVIRLYEDTEYYYELYGTKNKSLCISCDIYKGESWDSNEQACEAAIKYSLINLI